jgi:hypothetical protein
MMSGLHAHSGLALDIVLVLTPWGTFTSYSLPAFLAHSELGQKHRFDGRLVTSGLPPTPDISLYSAN